MKKGILSYTREVPDSKYIKQGNYQHFQFSINGGYSYLTAKISSSVPVDFKDYMMDLKSGYHYGGDVTYYFSEGLGLGFKYYIFKSKNSIDNIYVEDLQGNRSYGKLSDDITTSFIGPSFVARSLSGNKRNAFTMDISLGYMGYTDNAVVITRYKLTGNTIGFRHGLGYDISLSDDVSLGFQISLITGYLTEEKVDDGTTVQTIELGEGNYESLSRFDLSVGLRFNK